LQTKVLGMEKSSKRGKIPQHDWPSIISRYESGETLASIARTYDCSPPAISYIVSRTRARSLASEATTPKTDILAPVEPQLVKTGSATTTNDMADGELMHNSDPPEESKRPATQAVDVPNPSADGWFADPPPPPSATAQGMPQDDRSARRTGESAGDGRASDTRVADTGTRVGNGGSRLPAGSGASQPAGEARRTLHLSLPHGNGGAPHPAAQNPPNSGHASDAGASSGLWAKSELPPQPRPMGQAPASPQVGTGNPAGTEDPPNKARNGGGAFIDHALRERIDDDIAAFLAAFDAALDHDTVESRTGLREATDRLLRAGARTRIELERLEARLPLPVRDGGQRPFPAPRLR
jgi:hypothetical protein